MKPLPDNAHILLIDLNEKSRNTFKSTLTRFGFNVTFNTGNDILTMYQQLKPDFVFCYIQHNGVTSGYKIITGILEKFPDALIIGISFEFKPGYQKKLETMGAGYISKKLVGPQDIQEYLKQFYAKHSKGKS